MKYCKKHDCQYEKKCLICNREYQRKWFAENKETQLKRVTDNKNEHKIKLQNLVSEYLSSHPCIDCSETDHIVLDFDHIDPSLKSMSVSKIITNGYSEKKLIEEMNKCEIRCSNCHRRKTAKQFNTWRYIRFN